MNKPEKINILGHEYQIIYCDNPADVDLNKRESKWGEVDYWTRKIRIYDNGRSIDGIWQTIIHEVLHVIGESLKLECLDKGYDTDTRKHEELDMIAMALTDILFRNDFIKI